ncbi:MAG: ATP-binding protein [Candidatus Sumerlaeota bacterium]|nr:ATP-binding protein [Candidatus Sumerlaeota bacterium]
MHDRDQLKLTVPNDLAYYPIARSFVREVAKMIGFDGSELNQIEVGVEEAVTNVMKHAYDAEENSTFDIICEQIPAGIKIVLKEKGIPFDPENIPSYKPADTLDDISTSGIGVYLMKAVLDECSFHNLGTEGKETRLIKYLKDKPGQAPPVRHSRASAETSEPEVIKEKLDFDIRLMDEHEAIEVSRCAYKSHGYSFFDDHIYYPERLVELNKTGEMISAVAVTREGKFMGHAALLYQSPEDKIAELTFVFVNVEYRGQGAFNRLIEFLFSVPKPREMAGIYAYAVANHIFTQKATARYSINDCGILLATSPASWKFKGIAGDPSQRISVVLSFKYLETPKRLVLYPPEHHKEMIAKLYRNIGAEHDLVAPQSGGLDPAQEQSEIETSVNKNEGCAEIFVRRCGSNAAREIRKLLRDYCLQQYASINLFLNMGDPAIHALTREFEELGFFFAGILPCARTGDTFMLQYLNNVDMDYTKVTAYSGMAKEMLVYIHDHDPNASI